MKNKIEKLAKWMAEFDEDKAFRLYSLAGRYDEANIPAPIEMQPAFRYIMYLKLIRDIDDSIFYRMKRKYLNTSLDIQRECKEELDKLIAEDAQKLKIPSSEIRKELARRISLNKHIYIK